MSRTIDGKRGSDATSRSASALADRERVEIELGHEHVFGAGKAARFGDRRHELADDAQERARVPRARTSAARPATRNPCAAGRELGLDADGLADPLDDALGVEEVDGARRPRPVRPVGGAAPDERHRAALAGAREAAAGLEQPDVLPLAAAVVGAGVDQARQQRRPEDGELLRERVGDRCRLDARLAERRARVLLDEGERRRLRESGGRQDLPDEPVPRDLRRRRGLRRGERGKRDRQPVEAVVAPDLLDEVRFARDVDAEARHRHQPGGSAICIGGGFRDAEAECGEDPRDIVGRHGLAEQPGDARRAQPHLRGGRGAG